MTTTTDEIVNDVLSRLENAWNTADGTAFGDPFATDADFVDIRGTHHRGRDAIAGGHQAILDSIYKGSTTHYGLVQSTTVADSCILAVVQADLEAPSGPLQGTHRSTITALLVEQSGSWRIRSFHNTLVAT
jgi:uncharacterized protein (TIGR02246 family)